MRNRDQFAREVRFDDGREPSVEAVRVELTDYGVQTRGHIQVKTPRAGRPAYQIYLSAAPWSSLPPGVRSVHASALASSDAVHDYYVADDRKLVILAIRNAAHAKARYHGVNDRHYGA